MCITPFKWLNIYFDILINLVFKSWNLSCSFDLSARQRGDKYTYKDLYIRYPSLFMSQILPEMDTFSNFSWIYFPTLVESTTGNTRSDMRKWLGIKEGYEKYAVISRWNNSMTSFLKVLLVIWLDPLLSIIQNQCLANFKEKLLNESSFYQRL